MLVGSIKTTGSSSNSSLEDDTTRWSSLLNKAKIHNGQGM